MLAAAPSPQPGICSSLCHRRAQGKGCCSQQVENHPFPVIPSVALHRTFHRNIYHQDKLLPQSGEGHSGDVNLGLISPSLSVHLYIHLLHISPPIFLPAHSGLQDAFVTCCRQLPSSLLRITRSQQQSYVRMKPEWKVTLKPKQN